MYKVLPPPYKQEDMFTIRVAPPGYEDKGWSGEGSARRSLQVIGGVPPEDVEVQLGWADIKLTKEGGILDIDYDPGAEANVGVREETIGMGEGQIPVEVWRQAKEEGISVEELTGRMARDEEGESRLVPYESRLVPEEKELQVPSMLPDREYPLEDEAKPLGMDVEMEAIGGLEPEADVVWVDSWRAIPAPDADSSLKAYHDPKTDTIYAIKGVTTQAEVEHERYHSLMGHEDVPEEPRIHARHELEGHKYAYERMEAPKHVLQKLRAIFNDLVQNQYDVEPHEAMAVLESEFERINPPLEWRDDFHKLQSEFDIAYGQVKRGTLVPSSKLLLPEQRRLLGGKSRLAESAMVMESSEEDEDEDERKRLRKPKGYKDWWEAPYYGRRNARRVPERTYFGHKLLPPDLGGSL